ncbi:MAG TPA: hypothetical protein VGZ27_20325 [Vicinamibacterales bacterium]|nr:hypothetical protein [Vicinamibacterales bacterium]
MDTHRAVFTWVQQRLVEAGLLKGKTVAIDATTVEANAAMRSGAKSILREGSQLDIEAITVASSGWTV